MRYLHIVLVLLMCASVFGKADPGSEPDTSQIAIAGSASLTLNSDRFDLLEQVKTETQVVENKNRKSGLKAAMMSAIIPGAGEYYAKSYWKSALFLSVEILAWTGYFIYEHKGDTEDKKMRGFADKNWSEQRYWSRVYDEAVKRDKWTGDPLSVDENRIILNDDYTNDTISELRRLERSGELGFTHTLPETKTQQYYEMIYKYLLQFGGGWVDVPSIDYYNQSNFTQPTPLISRYRDIRNTSNDFYDLATTMSGVALMNHLLSALDGALSVKKYNKRVGYSVRIGQQYYAGERMRTYGVYFSW
ncbi:MAG: DUF5683 domain-containing protein [Calditrichaceae bacterium]